MIQKTMSVLVFALLFILFACSQGPVATESPLTATATKPPSTATQVPTATITLTPTSTPQVMMVSQTPIPLNKITVENASQLELLTKLSPDIPSDVLAFSPDGTTLAAGLAKEAFWKELLGSNKIQIWDLSNSTLAHTIDIPGTLSSFSYEDGYLKVATCTKGAWYGCLGSEIFHWQPSDQSLESKGEVKGLVYVFPPKEMPTVLHLSTTVFDNYQLWNLEGGNPQKIYDIVQTTEWDAAMSYSIDGEHFVIGIGTSLKLYQTNSNQPIILEDPGDKNPKRYNAIVFSPDGSIIASGDTAGNIKLWQVSDGTILQKLNGHTAAIDTMAFSADGSMLISISADNTLRIWNVADGTSLITINDVCAGTGYKAARCAIAFSPTGTLIASVGWPDKNILLWGIR